jgi:glycosyltransferase involved in cell wall biosynthesis
MVELSVIMPAYNESAAIFKSIKETERVLSDARIDYELIVVDDGSRDDTFVQASSAGSNRVKVVRKENGGKGSAIKFGFSFSRGKMITFIDADLDLHPKHIPVYISLMKRHGVDIVIGSKRHPLSKLNYPIKRKILSYCYYILVKTLFGLKVKDTQAGLKLFKREVLETVLPRVLCKKYAFDLELLAVANAKGFTMMEAPVELNWQRMESRIRLKDILMIAIDTAAIFYRQRILHYYNGD